jgi:alpha-D-xyloside xylohydrolase
MNTRSLFALVLSFVCFCAAGSGVVRNGNSVSVQLTGYNSGAPRYVRLQVLGPRIIRVQASPSAIDVGKKSLIIVPQLSAVPFTVQDAGDSVRISTSDVSAHVCTADGQVSFFDAAGLPILRQAPSGMTFKPITVDGAHGYSWQLRFLSPDDEAFYGLGQHQAGEMNYKGKNEELFQYNTKISLPFIVSNRNYGILWDSYSLCRFGSPDDYQQLGRIFDISDAQGHAGCLTGVYTDAGGHSVTRSEDSIYFENLATVKNLPKDFSLHGSHVTFSGFISAKSSAVYRFILYYAGYTKVYINNELVVPEIWRTAWNPNSRKFSVNLKAGVRVPIRIEWQPDGEVSYCGLRALAPVSESEQGNLSVWSEMSPDLDYYFIGGNCIDDVIAGYRQLTGKAEVMPRWAMGFWQSRERYVTQHQVVSTLQEFRRRGLPIDNIVQDWFYWKEDQWGSHQFDPLRYPSPQAMLDSIHSLHGRFMISAWPKFYVNTDNFKAFDSHGWMYRQAVTDSIRDWVGSGHVGSFYDAYSADARRLFWKQIDDNLYSRFNHGIDAWWMDASEPNIRDCTDIGYRKRLCGPTALGPSTEYFNAYALMNAEAIYNGQRASAPGKRVFLLTRSGFAGLQRYSTASWSGDIASRWEDMRSQMTAGLNYCISGIPFWGMDIGGFCVEDRYVAAQKQFESDGTENADLAEWRELQARWNQFGAFVPIYRSHGQYPLREPWNLAPASHPCYLSIDYYLHLRYRLMPYIYSLAGMTWLRDYTPMRALVMDFEGDANVNNIGDQWMFGPALMACPVSTYKARSREVYFPKGCGWRDFYTGRHIQGGQRLSVDAPYEQIPLFVREGSIIPFGKPMQYSDEKRPDNITLLVYSGADGSFTLYEDDGVTYNYEKGAYSTIPITYDDSAKSLTIGSRSGSFKDMLATRHFNVVLVPVNSSAQFNLDSVGRSVTYTGASVTVSLK